MLFLLRFYGYGIIWLKQYIENGVEIVRSYKWIVFDLDGTVLNSDKEIPEENRKAIDLLRANGIEVIIATGRHHSHASKYLYELGITTPVISCNGALIRDFPSGKLLHKVEIDPDIALNVINYCKQSGLDFLVYTPEFVYYSEGSERAKAIEEYNRSVSEQMRVPLYNINTLDVSKQSIVKVVVRSKAYYELFKKLTKDINKDGRLTIVKSENDLLDIMTKGVSKGQGLKFLAKHLGMDLSCTAVFGDNHNDISMFEVAGLSIAVGNAEEELREIADHITLSNDESGVSHAIYKYILPNPA